MAPRRAALALALAGLLAAAPAAAEAPTGPGAPPPALRRGRALGEADVTSPTATEAGLHPLGLAGADHGSSGDETTKAPEETTQPPEEETTTPAPPQSAESIFHSMVKAVEKQLRSPEHQWVNALIASAFGIAMVSDGEDVFKWLVIAAVFLLSSILAMSDLSIVWSLDSHSTLRRVVGLEVGALGAYAALLGIEGVMVVVGALLGGCVAFSAQQQFVAWGATAFQDEKPLVVCLYTILILAAVFLFKRKKHVRGLAVLSAFIGGALVSSAVSWGVTALAVNGRLNFLWSVFPAVAPKGGAWLDFLLLLFSTSSPDFGVFSGSPYDFQISGQTYRVDRVGGIFLGLVLFAIGVKVQLRGLRLKEEAVAAREPGALQRALLEKEEE